MTKVLTLRLPSELLRKAEGRASQMGLARTKYVRALIERDVTPPGGQPRKHVFASEDLAGYYEGEAPPATNAIVRAQMRGRGTRKR